MIKILILEQRLGLALLKKIIDANDRCRHVSVNCLFEAGLIKTPRDYRQRTKILNFNIV